MMPERDPLRGKVKSPDRVGNCRKIHCVKSVRIGSFSGPYFITFGLN